MGGRKAWKGSTQCGLSPAGSHQSMRLSPHSWRSGRPTHDMPEQAEGCLPHLHHVWEQHCCAVNELGRLVHLWRQPAGSKSTQAVEIGTCLPQSATDHLHCGAPCTQPACHPPAHAPARPPTRPPQHGGTLKAPPTSVMRPLSMRSRTHSGGCSPSGSASLISSTAWGKRVISVRWMGSDGSRYLAGRSGENGAGGRLKWSRQTAGRAGGSAGLQVGWGQQLGGPTAPLRAGRHVRQAGRLQQSAGRVSAPCGLPANQCCCKASRC